MGGAYVAIVDDEQAIFLNPAGLAGNEKAQFHYVAADLTVSTDLVASFTESAEAFGNLSPETLNVLMGKNIYSQVMLTPTLLMPNFGVSVLVDGQYAVLAENKALPQLTLGYQTTNGGQAAYGFKLGGRRRSRSELRLGIGGKVLWRRGGYNTLSLSQILSIGPSTLSEVSGNFGMGLGLDLGSQYRFKLMDRLTLSSGVAFTDIGDTSFGEMAAPVKNNLSVGVAAQYDLRYSSVVLAYDYQHLLEETDWRKKTHVGLGVILPMVSLYGGINQVSLTYGASVDLWLFRVTALSYAEEQGSYAFQDSMRRWVLRFSLKLDL